MAVGTRPEVLLPDELDRLPKAVYLAVKPENGGMGLEARQWAGNRLHTWRRGD